jgi:hypothetical protein
MTVAAPAQVAEQPAEPARRPPTWKAKPIARALNLTERQVYHLAEVGAVRGLRKIPGAGLCFDPDGVLGA